MSGKPFEKRALIIIIPFAAAFLLGCIFICRHKVYLWTLKKDDSGSDAGVGPKADAKNAKKSGNSGDKYQAPADPESGQSRGAESESDSILITDSGKGGNRKSFCA